MTKSKPIAALVATGHASTVSRRDPRPSCELSSTSLNQEGAGNAGWFGHTHGLACEIRKHTSKSPQVSPAHRHSLHDGFNGLLRALPGEPGFLATIACEIISTSLTPASGRQDHTASPSALRAPVLRARSVHRIPQLNVRDDSRNAPREEAGHDSL